MLEAMLQGWARQQRTRFLNEKGTIKPREAMVRRLVDFSNLYPWQGQPPDAEAFISHLPSPNRSRPTVMSPGRRYEPTPAPGMGFITHRPCGRGSGDSRRLRAAPVQ